MSALLRIADLTFPVSSALMKGYCYPEHMAWDFEVRTTANPSGEFHSHSAKLSLCPFRSKPGELIEWKDLAPRSSSWIEKNDTDVFPSGMLYLFEHTPVFQCTVELSRQTTSLVLNASGKCDVHFNDRYSVDLDFNLEGAEITFEAIWMGRRPKDQCFQMVAPFLDHQEFEFHRTEKGVSKLVPTVTR